MRFSFLRFCYILPISIIFLFKSPSINSKQLSGCMTCDEVTVSVDYMSFFNCEITHFPSLRSSVWKHRFCLPALPGSFLSLFCSLWFSVLIPFSCLPFELIVSRSQHKRLSNVLYIRNDLDVKETLLYKFILNEKITTVKTGIYTLLNCNR